VSAQTNQTAGQVARFGLVGVFNTLLDYVVFITLTIVFSIPLSRVWTAKYASSAVAMIVSFVLNRRFVFRSQRRDVRGEVFRFVTATLIGVFVIQNLLTQFFSSDFQYFGTAVFRAAEAIGLSELTFTVHDRTVGITESFTIKTVAFGLATVASLTWNFFAYKYWAFRPDDRALACRSPDRADGP
jgi:putative flippase GtrA